MASIDLGQTPVTAASGGGGSGTVTQVNTGAGLTGGPITGSGTLSGASISLVNQVVGSVSISQVSGIKGPNIITLSSGSAQTYTPSAGVTWIIFKGVGAGGGGGSAASTNNANSGIANAGGGGGYFEKTITGSALQTSYIYSIAGITPGGTAAGNGVTGTSSSLMPTVSSATTFLIGGGGGGGAGGSANLTTGGILN